MNKWAVVFSRMVAGHTPAASIVTPHLMSMGPFKSPSAGVPSGATSARRGQLAPSFSLQLTPCRPPGGSTDATFARKLTVSSVYT